jgi:hypothetical protein
MVSGEIHPGNIKKINRRERGERRAELKWKDVKKNWPFLNFVF